jgi:O-antigen ligase
MAARIRSLAERILPRSWEAAWAITLVVLPVTSFPLLSKLAGGTLVAPLSILPLVWLVLTWLPYYLAKKKNLPGELKPLLWFIYFVLISCGLAFFLKMPEFKGHRVLADEVEAIITLGIGVSFLLVTISRVKNLEEIKKSLFWINIGGIIFIAWSLVQVSTIWFLDGTSPELIKNIQSLISTGTLNDRITATRISGLSLEPSWLAHSLNLLYLPVWLAASRYKVSAYKIKLGIITVENILLVGGIFAMIMTYSRIGLLGFLAVLGWFIVDAVNQISRRLPKQKESQSRKPSRIRSIYITGAMIISLLAGFIILIYLLSYQDVRFRKLYTLITDSSSLYEKGHVSIINLAKKLNFGERVVYWEFGWNVFNAYPVFGVGLGNAGRFSEQMFSPEAWNMSEVRKILYYESPLPNTKNLWVRILSETGLVGFSFFSTWLIILWLGGRKLGWSPTPILQAIGLTGQLVLIAQIFEGFSLDTFALPYVWVSLGLLTAGISFGRQQVLSYEA